MMSDLLSDLRACLRYEPETGLFYWLVKRNGYGGGVSPGDIAGTPHDGYVVIRVDQRNYRAHRLAWFFMTGEWPPKGFEVDHEDTNRSNNRWKNLRLATKSQNMMNVGPRSDSSSGVKGVTPCSRRGRAFKWDARITVNKKTILLGQFANFDEACRARREAELKHFGQFAHQRG